jgi:hypothetical protein
MKVKGSKVGGAHDDWEIMIEGEDALSEGGKDIARY